ncbi:efflux RND transporter permease subunit [Planctomycetes bacterium K23_9]|uniref:MMPL family protein n=1 Tax=Stieleria marina TaxID=1930275 RepID=A0A517P3G5_9BACT|nr:MMPL family protein [Planctomycetes bacterium K23_9]
MGHLKPETTTHSAVQAPTPQARSRRWTRALADRLVNIRVVAVLSAIALFAIAYPIACRLEMNRSVSAMFAPDDPTMRDYRQLQTAFGGNAVAIMVYRDTDLFSPEGFSRSRQISEQVLAVDGVDEILSPSILSDLVAKIRPSGFLTGFSSKVPPLMRRRDVVARGIDKLFAGYTHSEDHQQAAVVAMLDPQHTPDTIEAIKSIAASLPDQHLGAVDQVALVGEPLLVHDGFALIERDGTKLATWTIILLSIVVLITLVDLRFVLLSAASIVWSITITQAIMVLSGIQLSLVSTILTAIVTVIAVASVLHLGVRFRIARTRGYEHREATVRSLGMLVMPIFWTCATDAAGFAALRWSRILPVQQFGWSIAIASTCVFLSILLIAPAIMMLPNWRTASKLHQWQSKLARQMRRLCLRIAMWFVAHRQLSVAVAVVMMIVSAMGVWRTETETSFLKNFRPDSPIVVDYDRVEKTFGGAGVWDIIVDAPPEISKRYLADVLKLEDDLRKIQVDGVSLAKVISVADASEIAGKAPGLKYLPPPVKLRAMRLIMPLFVNALLTPPTAEPELRHLRIMLRSREHSSALQKSGLIDAVNQVVKSHTLSAQWRGHFKDVSPPPRAGRVTGYYVMMSRLVSQLIRDQWRCFIASSILIWLLLLAATRSPRLSTAALLPNLLPVLFVLAVVGLSGDKINMGAAMIAAVSVGLSIDGSVHFLATYRRHRDEGHSCKVAATHASGNVGVPVLLATIALVIGFSVLATSDFVPTATFGLLVAITLAAGTVINLTILPAFVSWIDR